MVFQVPPSERSLTPSGYCSAIVVEDWNSTREPSESPAQLSEEAALCAGEPARIQDEPTADGLDEGRHPLRPRSVYIQLRS